MSTVSSLIFDMTNTSTKDVVFLRKDERKDQYTQKISYKDLNARRF
jgi:hypothetical protein